MLPITHQLLKERYDRFASPQLNPRLIAIRESLTARRRILEAHASTKDSSVREEVRLILSESIPAGIDSSMYCIRCACEEAASRAMHVRSMGSISVRLYEIGNILAQFQRAQREHVSEVITAILPRDFRASIFATLRQRSERSNMQQIEDLVNAGGSIREKYALLWEQQYKRRESLAMIGNASGVFRWMMRYLGGVPAPLLAFARDINAPNGPTEALRVKFGDTLRQLVAFAIEMNALCALVHVQCGEEDEDVREELEEAVKVYEEEVTKFVRLLHEVIVDSPFFVSPEEVRSGDMVEAKE